MTYQNFIILSVEEKENDKRAHSYYSTYCALIYKGLFSILRD